MTPVISPWVFYFMYVADNIVFASTTVFFVGVIGGLIGLIFTVIISYDEDEFKARAKQLLKVALPVIVVSCLMTSFVPNEQTVTKMIVAQNVTYERVEMATDTVKTVYNDIMELFEESD